MSDASLPDDVRRFVLAHISSVPHLEALLLLRGEAERAWDCAAAAKRLFLTERRARKLLTDLSKIGLLERIRNEPPSYRFAPSAHDIAQLVGRVADAYARNLIEMTHLIHSRDEHQARHFADAFTLRKDR